MWKRKVQETSSPIFKIKGKATTQSGTFWSGWDASSLYWWIQVYCYLLRQLFFIWDDVLFETQKWRIRCIQGLQGLGQEATHYYFKMQALWLRRRIPVKWTKNIYGREWNTIPNVHARQSTTKWTSRKVPANHHKWSWGYVASHWLIQQFLDICGKS